MQIPSFFPSSPRKKCGDPSASERGKGERISERGVTNVANSAVPAASAAFACGTYVNYLDVEASVGGGQELERALLLSPQRRATTTRSFFSPRSLVLP